MLRGSKLSTSNTVVGNIKLLINFAFKFVHAIFTDWYFFWPWLGIPLLLGELLLCVVMIHKVPYTKIDWDAYMEEVEGPLIHDNWDYTQLKGDTGPLVYPAGFVWLYGALRWIAMGGMNTLWFNVKSMVGAVGVVGTDNVAQSDASSFVLRDPLDPVSIRVAQYIFVGMYVATQGLVFDLYKRASSSRVPPWVCVLLCLSKRMHSLYSLRLFNDCWAMFFLYLALHLFTNTKKWWKWPAGCFVFSVAVSIKMNILLFAPALWMLMIVDIGMYGSLSCIFICALVQLLAGAPFLANNFWGYIGRSFEMGRVFTFKWSVNYKFLPENIFVSKQFAIGLLCFHLLFLGLFFTQRWYPRHDDNDSAGKSKRRASGGGGMVHAIRDSFNKKMAVSLVNSDLNIEFLLLTMFTSNFIGIVFCRSLHFQFYCWYFHTVPFLLWQNDQVPTIVKIMVLVGLEFTWSYCLDPVEGTSTPLSSSVLQFTHCVMLLCLWLARPVERTLSKKFHLKVEKKEVPNEKNKEKAL